MTQTVAPGDRRLQTALLIVSFAALLVSWALVWKILLETPLIDITGLEVALAIGGVLLLAGGTWRPLRRHDRPLVIAVAVYLGWFLVTALARGSGEDVKRAVSYLVFLGLAFAVGVVAVRLDPPRAARWIAAFFGVVLVVALAGAAFEQITYPGDGRPDPLAPFWSIFRRTEALVDPRLGVLEPFPIHYPIGEAGLVRTSGVFAHPLYLAFFGLLVTPLTTAGLLRSWRAGERRMTVVFVALLAAAIFLTYWTYSRSALAAMVVAIPATVAVDYAVRGRLFRLPTRQELASAAVAVATLVVVLAGSLLVDDAGLRRLQGTAILSEDISESSIEASAARSAARRLATQALAVEMITSSPRALAVGVGMTAYEVALLEDLNREHPEPVFHPHNLWLTEALAGGIPAVVLFLIVLAIVWLGLTRTLRRGPPDWPTSTVMLWLAAWIPVWALAQIFGLNPFAAQEAVILGTMLGFAWGFAYSQGPSALRE